MVLNIDEQTARQCKLIGWLIDQFIFNLLENENGWIWMIVEASVICIKKQLIGAYVQFRISKLSRKLRVCTRCLNNLF